MSRATTRLVAAAILAAAVSGCAGKGQAYENVYNMLQSREEVVNPLREKPVGEKPMSYEQYEKERKKVEIAR
jgi:hypothetical protein